MGLVAALLAAAGYIVSAAAADRLQQAAQVQEGQPCGGGLRDFGPCDSVLDDDASGSRSAVRPAALHTSFAAQSSSACFPLEPRVKDMLELADYIDTVPSDLHAFINVPADSPARARLDEIFGRPEKRMVLVGNGPVSGNFGSKIDDFDVVVRINHFERNDAVGRSISLHTSNLLPPYTIGGSSPPPVLGSHMPKHRRHAWNDTKIALDAPGPQVAMDGPAPPSLYAMRVLGNLSHMDELGAGHTSLHNTSLHESSNSQRREYGLENVPAILMHCSRYDGPFKQDMYDKSLDDGFTFPLKKEIMDHVCKTNPSRGFISALVLAHLFPRVTLVGFGGKGHHSDPNNPILYDSEAEHTVLERLVQRGSLEPMDPGKFNEVIPGQDWSLAEGGRAMDGLMSCTTAEGSVGFCRCATSA